LAKNTTVAVDRYTSEALKFLSDKTERTKKAILKEIIGKLFVLASAYEDPNFWCDIKDGTTIILTVYGRKPLIVSGKTNLPDFSEEKFIEKTVKTNALKIEAPLRDAKGKVHKP
jgi:hypothetical protein